MVQSNKAPNTNSFKASSTSRASVSDPLRGLRQFLTFALSAFLTASVFLTPEGAVREGDYLPVALLFFLLTLGALLYFYRVVSSPSAQGEKHSSTANESVPGSVQPKKRSSLPFIADVALGVYLALATASCLTICVFHSGDLRFALNGYWTFITPALLYFLLRYFRSVVSEKVILELCLVLSACMLAECVYSAYSYAVVNPRLRAEYQANPDKMLAENGMSFEKDSRERILFEKRLLESTEPTGTYGLTNTLAGALAPILILGLVGIPWAAFGVVLFKRRQGALILQWTRFFLILAAFLLAFFILLTTKSRSACLALAAGLFVWLTLKLFLLLRSGKRGVRQCALGALCFGAFSVVAVIVSVLTGVVDREVFTEAGKSLSYRLDYWIATSRMIADHPFLGIGPGEFQSLYPLYILPSASEFIADPHNFLFELCALFGIPAVSAFLGFLLAAFVAALRVLWQNAGSNANGTGADSDEANLSPESSATDLRAAKRIHFAAFSGGLLGLFLTFGISFFQSAPVTPDFYLSAFSGIALVFFMTTGFQPLHAAEKRASVPTIALLVCLITLLVNLCAAGGIGYAPIASILFLCCAALVNRASFPVDPQLSPASAVEAQAYKTGYSRQIAAGLLLFTFAAFFVFYLTSYKPRTNAYMFELRYENAQNQYAEIFREGRVNQIDGASILVVSQYYYFSALEYSRNPSEENRSRWEAAREKVSAVSPNSPTIPERCGDFDITLYEKNRQRTDLLDSAVRFYQTSVDRSPTDVSKRVKLIRALRYSGKLDEARQNAKIALEFDGITPHEDRKLTEQEHEELDKLN